MTIDDAWSELGLGPTDDRRVLRRTYAQRLKATNPEDDPEGFKRLRGAYEMLLSWLDHQAAGLSVDERIQPEVPPGAHAPERQISPPEAEAQDPFAEHWARCRALVQKVQEGGASSDELLAELAAILKSPILDHLEVFQQTGLGFARALCEVSPRGDALVWPVLSHFGWRKSTAGWAQAPEIEALRDLGRRVTDRQSVRENRAYRILTSPPPRKPGRDTRWDLASVKRLIEAARSDEAWLLPELAPETVAWWERYGDPARAGRRKRNILLAIIAALVGLFVLVAIQDEEAGQAPGAVESGGGGEERIAAVADASPYDAVAWSRLCAVTARHWWRESSLSDCDHAVSLNPGRVETQLDRGFLHVKVGEGAAAEKFFDAILDEYPDDVLALGGRSLARAMENEIASGRRDWCRALKLDPDVRKKIEAIYEFKIDGAYEAC